MSQVLLLHRRDDTEGERERGSEGEIDGYRDENKLAKDKWIYMTGNREKEEKYFPKQHETEEGGKGRKRMQGAQQSRRVRSGSE